MDHQDSNLVSMFAGINPISCSSHTTLASRFSSSSLPQKYSCERRLHRVVCQGPISQGGVSLLTNFVKNVSRINIHNPEWKLSIIHNIKSCYVGLTDISSLHLTVIVFILPDRLRCAISTMVALPPPFDILSRLKSRHLGY
jgi:hypothetical protein